MFSAHVSTIPFSVQFDPLDADLQLLCSEDQAQIPCAGILRCLAEQDTVDFFLMRFLLNLKSTYTAEM